MCTKYKNNAYPTLWVFHFCCGLISLICLFAIKGQSLCKRLIISLFIVYHGLWGIADILCYSQPISSVIALFFGIYLSTLLYVGICDDIVDQFRCWCCKKAEHSPLLDEDLSNAEESIVETF